MALATGREENDEGKRQEAYQADPRRNEGRGDSDFRSVPDQAGLLALVR